MSMTITLDFYCVGHPAGVPSHLGLLGTLTSSGSDLVHRTAAIGSGAAEALDFGDITGAPALLLVKCNSDSASAVKLYTSAPWQFGVLAPGEFALLQVGSGSVEAQGSTGTASVEFIAIEGAFTGTLTKYVPGIGSGFEFKAGVTLSCTLNGSTDTISASFEGTLTNNRRYADTRVLAATTDDTSLPSIRAGYLLAYRTDAATATPGIYGQGESSTFASLATVPVCFLPWHGTVNIVLDADASSETVVDVVNWH